MPRPHSSRPGRAPAPLSRRARLGRPRKPRDPKRRPEPVSYTQDESDLVHAAATRSGMTFAEWARVVTLGQARLALGLEPLALPTVATAASDPAPTT